MSLPTLYEYYTNGGITTGLANQGAQLTLNGKNVTINSGAMHYFRVPRPYWRDRLRKIRSSGLNTVETYIPWNLHEPHEGVYDFGDGGTDWHDFLHLTEFLRTAQEEDLFAIVRPGPYICAEWDFGGLPSWLLRYKGMRLRTSQQQFMAHVRRYFGVLLKVLAVLQFTRGGPVVAFQVENEYGSTRSAHFVPDKQYLVELREIFRTHGIKELLLTSDAPSIAGDSGTLPEYFLQTANFGGLPWKEFARLKRLQGDKPLFAMEFWTGWFDHWGEEHHTRNDTDFQRTLSAILTYPASVNLYMFHGGTSFGFLNGANYADSSIDNAGYQPDTTSYDYDAPLRENGDYTLKYFLVKRLLEQTARVHLHTPKPPLLQQRIAYPNLNKLQQLTYAEFTRQNLPKHARRNLIPMEFLPINNRSGQSYGYITYRKTHLNLPPNAVLTITGRVCDTVLVLLNNVLISPALETTCDLDNFGFWKRANSTLKLTNVYLHNATLDLIVENWGRVNFGHTGQYHQLKGLWQGEITINRQIIRNWVITPLEFKTRWTNSLRGWRAVTTRNAPALYKSVITVNRRLDTYIDMTDWCKGIVIVNGFVLGRYARIGPQQALYLPGPLLKYGTNEIVIFEHYKAPPAGIKFSSEPIYKTIHC